MPRSHLPSKLSRARRVPGVSQVIALAARALRAAVLRDPIRAGLWSRLSRAAGHGSMRAAQRRRSAKAWAALAAASAALFLALWGLSSLAESVRIARRASDWIAIPGVILA